MVWLSFIAFLCTSLLNVWSKSWEKFWSEILSSRESWEEEYEGHDFSEAPNHSYSLQYPLLLVLRLEDKGEQKAA